MNLYSIDFQHYSPKDYERGIKELVLADNDEQVYNIIKENYSYSWSDSENDDPGFKPTVIAHKGEWDITELDDLYYGQTLYGWTLLVENTTADYSELIDAKVMIVCN